MEQTECIEEIEDGFYLNDTELKTIDKCHEDCRTCDKRPTENNTNCKSCHSDKYLYYGNCVSNCENGFFLDEKDNSIKICQCINKKCKYCSEEALSLDLCDNCNKDYYPIFNDSSNSGNFINCYKSKEGYYFDKKDNFFKKCYYTCKECNEYGDKKTNNCQKCIDNYKFLEDFPNDYNCYKNCSFYYYFDNEKNYFCTEDLQCPKEFNKLILEKNKCVDNCYKDEYYIYEFRKKCFNECPPNTKISQNKDYYCEIQCPKDYPFEMVEAQECVKNCTSNDRQQGLCIVNYKNETEDGKEIEEQIQKSIQEDITNGNINTSSISNGEDFSLNEGKTSFTVSTTKNQKMKEKTNETTIDLEECEQELKKHYGIPEDDTLYIYIIKVAEDGLIAQKVEYEVYYPLNGDKLEILDLSFCENTKADISVYAPINESELDKHDPNSGFYNDICYTYKSKNGTDMSLKDRKKLFVDNNYTLCEENCELKEYDEETQKAICSCQIKIKLPLISEIKIDKNKLYDSFSNIKNIANFKLMKCYYVLFTKEGILNNIGCYIMIPIIIMHFISFIVFYLIDYKKILNIIKDLIYIKKNWKFLNTNNHTKKKKKGKKNLPKIKKVDKQVLQEKTKKNNIREKIDKKMNSKSINPKKRNDIKQLKNMKKNNGSERNNVVEKENNLEKDTKREDDSLKNVEKPLFLKYLMKKGILNKLNFDKENINKKETNNYPPIKKYKERKKKKSYALNFVKTNGNVSNTTIKKIENSNQIKMFNNKQSIAGEKNSNKKENLTIDISIIKYNEYEMNTLPYNEAIKFDKRTYFQFYLSLLKIKHLIIFSFCPSKDYNSRIIKIYLFFFSFTIYYAVNAFFFNEDTMHRIYEDGGSFNFIYQIPQIIYSSLISSLLHSILKMLSLSERNILEIKKEKAIQIIDKKADEIIKCLSNKFMIFFIVSFIFLLFFWYYVACFCAIYKNTQIYLLKDSIISFGFSLLYPIGIYLVPGIFRIPAIRAVKGDRETMYKFSKIIQLI